jgi:hypothetical protein
MQYPEFIIAGVHKGGSTALWYNLDKHPKIHMAVKSESVEIHFWGSKFKRKGHDWYKSFFKDGCIGGEKSPGYYMSTPSMRQISKSIPECKIILCVRNPVDRAYSHYQMHLSGRKKHSTPSTFSVEAFKPYRNAGRYWHHIKKNILPFFNKEQIFICVMEEMKQDITKKMGDVFEFIGVDDLALSPKIIDPILRRNRTRKEDVKLSRTENFYRVWSHHPLILSGELRKQLLNYYAEDNKNLFDFLGREIKAWKK